MCVCECEVEVTEKLYLISEGFYFESNIPSRKSLEEDRIGGL